MENKTIRVALYIRVSTSKQVEEGFSLEAQKRELESFAEYKHMQVVNIYADEGISGKSTDGREAFNTMISSIVEGNKDKLDYVLVFKLSRFGRNASDVLTNLQLMQDHGVNLICVKDFLDSSSASGKLLTTILAAVAEMERDTILTQMISGKRQKAMEGGWAGGNTPYGYKLDKATGDILVDENQAEIVKIIFDKYINEDMGMGSIAKYLNDMGYVKEIRGKNEINRFSQPFIQRTLDNPFYIGKMTFGRTATVKSNDGSRGNKRVRTKDYAIVDGKHEPLISKEVFELATEKRTRTGVQWRKKFNLEHAHLLTGLIKCPVCNEQWGTHLYGNISRSHRKDRNGNRYPDYFYYCCPNRKGGRDGKQCTFNTMIVQSELDRAVEEIIHKLVNNPKFAKDIKNKINTGIDTTEIDTKLDELEKVIRKLSYSKNRAIKELDMLDYEDKHYERRYEDLQSRITDLYNQMESVEDEIESLKARLKTINEGKITVQHIYQILANFDQFYSKFDEFEKQEFMRTFIQEIEIYEKPLENGQRIKRIVLNFPIDNGIDNSVLEYDSTTEKVETEYKKYKAKTLSDVEKDYLALIENLDKEVKK